MLNNKYIETLISLQIIIVSTMLPAYITIPNKIKIIEVLDLPITWQIPLIITLTIIFKSKVVFSSYTIYIAIGLFIFPVFYDGGSLGYVLTPNFGYLLGIYPLIKVIDNLYNGKEKVTFYKFIKSCFFGIIIMHCIGIGYNCIQLLYFKRTNLLLYNIANYSLGKIHLHFLMSTPIAIILKSLEKLRYDE